MARAATTSTRWQRIAVHRRPGTGERPRQSFLSSVQGSGSGPRCRRSRPSSRPAQLPQLRRPGGLRRYAEPHDRIAALDAEPRAVLPGRRYLASLGREAAPGSAARTASQSRRARTTPASTEPWAGLPGRWHLASYGHEDAPVCVNVTDPEPSRRSAELTRVRRVGSQAEAKSSASSGLCCLQSAAEKRK